MSNMFAKKFYLHDEIVIHNKLDDLWVVLNNKVLDLSDLFKNFDSIFDEIALMELWKYAGKNISTFFDSNGQPLKQISYSGRNQPLLAATLVKSMTNQIDGSTAANTFWWNNPKYEIGFVTQQERIIRIINTLTHSVTMFTVCDEDTIHIIKCKYNERFNSLNQNYVWRKCSDCDAIEGCLDERKTLIENKCSFEGQPYRIHPAIWLYYISDFNTL